MRKRRWDALVRLSTRVSAVMLVCVLALLIVLSLSFAGFSLRTLDQASAVRAQQLARGLDQSIERLIRYAFTIYNDPDVFRWLYESRQEALSDIQLVNTIRRYMDYEPLLLDITLLNDRTGRSYSTLQGMATKDSYRDPVLLNDMLGRTGLIRIQRHGDTLAFSLPASLVSQQFHGLMILQIDAERMREGVLGQAEGNVSVFVLNQDDEPMLGSAPADWAAKLEEAQAQTSRSWLTMLHAPVLAHEYTIDSQPWRLAYLVDVVLFEGQDAFLRVLYVSLALTLLVTLGSVLLGLRNTYAPVSLLARQLERELGGDVPLAGGSEAEVLRQGVGYLLEELARVRDLAAESDDIGEIRQGVLSLCEAVDRALRARQDQKGQQMLEQVLDMVNERLDDPNLSADAIADRVGLSTNYLRKLFKERSGASLSDYIRELRMNRAKDLLTTTQLSVAEIMAQTGYTNRSSFFTSFKRTTGMTPEQYRHAETPD